LDAFSCRSLQDFETGLTEIVGGQKQNVDELLRLVNENKKIIESMKNIVTGDVAQIIVRRVLSGDKDGNFEIDDKDVGNILLQLDTVEFVTVDENKFRLAVERSQRNVMKLLALIHDILEEKSVPDDVKFLKIKLGF